MYITKGLFSGKARLFDCSTITCKMSVKKRPIHTGLKVENKETWNRRGCCIFLTWIILLFLYNNTGNQHHDSGSESRDTSDDPRFKEGGVCAANSIKDAVTANWCNSKFINNIRMSYLRTYGQFAFHCIWTEEGPTRERTLESGLFLIEFFVTAAYLSMI